MCIGMYISYIPVMLRSTGFATLRNSSYSPLQVVQTSKALQKGRQNSRSVQLQIVHKHPHLMCLASPHGMPGRNRMQSPGHLQ